MRTGFRFVALALLAGALAAGCGGSKVAKGTATTPGADGRIAIAVTEDGFVPATVEVHAGEPVTLVVTRKTDKTCATELVMPAMGIDQKLPLNQPVEISFTPGKAETLDYACAMDMIKGHVVVK